MVPVGARDVSVTPRKVENQGVYATQVNIYLGKLYDRPASLFDIAYPHGLLRAVMVSDITGLLLTRTPFATPC